MIKIIIMVIKKKKTKKDRKVCSLNMSVKWSLLGKVHGSRAE